MIRSAFPLSYSTCIRPFSYSILYVSVVQRKKHVGINNIVYREENKELDD